MLLKNLTKVWISEYTESNVKGEKNKTWTYKGTAFLNLQNDISELDRTTAGEADYSIINARSDIEQPIQKGDGVSFTDISNLTFIVPEYTIKSSPLIGGTRLYKLEQYKGPLHSGGSV